MIVEAIFADNALSLPIVIQEASDEKEWDLRQREVRRETETETEIDRQTGPTDKTEKLGPPAAPGKTDRLTG